MKKAVAGEKAVSWRTLRFWAQVIAGRRGCRFALDNLCQIFDGVTKHGGPERERSWNW